MVGHESQWTKAGEYRSFTVAEIPFVVIRGEDDKLRAFHNVCRHRAYTVVRKPAGKTLRIFCKYHGWTYDTAGNLLKAPSFPTDSPEEFDMTKNGLFEIHLKIDSAGFIFVNFATNLADAFPWSDISPSRLRALDFGRAEEWEIEMSIDWRLASKSPSLSLSMYIYLGIYIYIYVCVCVCVCLCVCVFVVCVFVVYASRETDAGSGLLPWFIDSAALSGTSWPRRCLSYLSNAKSTPLQYVDDASFICTIKDNYHLLISALPADGRRTIIKTTLIPRQSSSSTRTVPNKQLQIRVNEQVRSAIKTLRQHRTTNTNLDFRQSAIRERLDKFNRHIYHHKAMEKVAGKKVNAAARVTGQADVDVEAEAICSALERPEIESLGLCSSLASQGELEW